MKVLHVESGRYLYGGARQVLYILEGLKARGVDNLLACPPGSDIAKAAGAAAQVFEVPMAGDADVGLVLRLRRLIQRERPHLVHLHSRRGADLFGGLAAERVVPVDVREVPAPPGEIALSVLARRTR